MTDDTTACSCMRVVYKPKDHGDGTMSERWVCELSDDHVFVRAGAVQAARAAQRRTDARIHVSKMRGAETELAALRERIDMEVVHASARLTHCGSKRPLCKDCQPDAAILRTMQALLENMGT